MFFFISSNSPKTKSSLYNTAKRNIFLLQNKKETVKSIAEHMEVSCTDQLLDEIVSATEFETMKKAKHGAEQSFRNAFGNQASLYRKGKSTREL